MDTRRTQAGRRSSGPHLARLAGANDGTGLRPVQAQLGAEGGRDFGSAPLVLDAEAGLLSIQDVPVDVISLRSWTDARDIACFFGRANPAFRDDQP